ncbi:GroES-like protein [Exidia glandulosa HHB12029]|uniref:GroES-like protein n=1 Tax=Exidia glandulosa HHB12029 TaxID=1314781 RepID=A0A165G295_EXIGL|nr:GroES-like protein [Exidia glandulosa HHB12029]
MQAVVVEEPGRLKIANAPIPVPRRGQILVKVEACAQNPVDVLFITQISRPGSVVGCDFVGSVAQIAADVSPGLRVGQRVAGFIYGGSNIGITQEDGGAFAQYLVADAALVVPIPSSLSVEEAAGIGIAPFTACQVLHQSLQLPLLDLLSPSQPSASTSRQGQWLLVWSGASAVGQYTIQLAAKLGLRVITTASPARHDLLRRLGARTVLDYHDADIVERVRSITGNKLTMALDCSGSPETVAACMGEAGGVVSLILPNKAGPSRKDVAEKMSLVFTLLGKAVQAPVAIPAIPPHHADGEQYAQLLGSLLAQRKLKVVAPRVFPGGLRGVPEGLRYALSGQVHAEKVTFVL